MEVTVAQMKQLEHDADAAGLSYTQMMENAGQAAARLLLEQTPGPLNTAAIFCGSGNNGGDGFVLARALAARGTQVRIILVEGQPKTEDAALNYQKIREYVPVLSLSALTAEDQTWILSADAAVDAIYGTGFHGALRPAGQEACSLLSRSAGLRFALDLPSGLAADSGLAAPGAVQADLTVAFHASKPCHRLNPGQCGRTEIVSIGMETVL